MSQSFKIELGIIAMPPSTTREQEVRLIFRYTILYVSDVTRSLAFYEHGFGLKPAMVHPSGDYAELATGSTKLAFSSRSLMKSLGKDPALPDPERPVFEIAFETDDVGAALERANAAGGETLQEVRVEAWGQTTAYVRDPDGYFVEVCSPIAKDS